MWMLSVDVEFEYCALMAAERSMYSQYPSVISVTVSLNKALSLTDTQQWEAELLHTKQKYKHTKIHKAGCEAVKLSWQ